MGHVVPLPLQGGWDALGPFPIGTREAAWGADPLEAHGGFHRLERDDQQTFPSSLAPNCSVRWKSMTPRSISNSATSSLEFTFNEIDWKHVETVNGWSGLQWQAWARLVFFTTGKTQKLLLRLRSILEFWLDDEHHFGGDYYGLQLAPAVLDVSPGRHVFEVRLIRDVRAMGSTSPGSVTVGISFERVRSDSLRLVESNALFPDVVDGVFAGDLASVTLTNITHEPIHVRAVEMDKSAASVELAGPDLLKIWPGQSRAIPLSIKLYSASATHVEFDLCATSPSSSNIRSRTCVRLRHQSKDEAHKMTFMHPASIVSYAMIRPPSAASIQKLDRSYSTLPIIVFLHGSGVHADSAAVTDLLYSVKDVAVWTLFPAGVTAWAADDWHSFAWAEVEACISSIQHWIKLVNWAGPTADVSRLIVAGHSNGGQGVYYALSHVSDKVFAGVAASAYLSIQRYVPYDHWTDSESALRAICGNALNSYKHELLVPSRATGIPLAIQHGSIDNNVPVFHARRMLELLRLNGVGDTATYMEVPGANHEFDGMMATSFLTAFFKRQVKRTQRTNVPPSNFAVVSANPGDTFAKFGINITEIEIPGRLATIDVRVNHRTELIELRTSNVRQLEISGALNKHDQMVDGQRLSTSFPRPSQLEAVDGIWCANAETYSCSLGGLDAFLRGRGSYSIVVYDAGALEQQLQTFAVTMSRNFMQYYSLDVNILHNTSKRMEGSGNVLRIGISDSFPSSELAGFPLQLSSRLVEVKAEDGIHRFLGDANPGLGAIFLRPRGQAVDLIVWGADAEGLRLAGRLAPLMTGTGVPDFVITSRPMLWKGISGVLAMGFFDGRLTIRTAASYFT